MARPVSRSPRVIGGGVNAPVSFPPLAKRGLGGVVRAPPVSIAPNDEEGCSWRNQSECREGCLFIVHPDRGPLAWALSQNAFLCFLILVTSFASISKPPGPPPLTPLSQGGKGIDVREAVKGSTVSRGSSHRSLAPPIDGLIVRPRSRSPPSAGERFSWSRFLRPAPRTW